MVQKIEDLLAANPNLKEAVQALIQGCAGSNAGHKALDEWDRIRTAEGTPSVTGDIEIRTEYDDDDSNIIAEVNEALQKAHINAAFVCDNQEHDGFNLFALKVG
jgi:hypothetical protein